MPCCTASSVASRTRSSAYFTVRITFPPILRSPNPPRQTSSMSNSSSSIHFSFLPLVYFSLTHRSMYNFLITLLSRQSIPVRFRICKYLCQSMKHAHDSLPMSEVRSAIILSTPIVSLAPFPLLNPDWFSPNTSSVCLSKLSPSILATIFTLFVMRLIVWRSLHFVALGLFFKQSLLRSLISLDHSPVSYALLICCVTVLRPHFLNNLNTSPGTISSPAAILALILLISSHSVVK